MRRTVDIVAILIQNPRNSKLLVHKRANNKKTFPGKLALGAGTYVQPNELPPAAVKRALRNELAIRKCQPPVYLVSFDYLYNLTLQKTHVYYLTYDKKITRNPKDFAWIKWMTVKEIQKWIKRGKFCPDTVKYYNHWLFETPGLKLHY